MVEEIHTGGLKKFLRGKESSELEPEIEKSIDEAYVKATERKKRNKLIKISVIILIIILILLFVLFLI